MSADYLDSRAARGPARLVLWSIGISVFAITAIVVYCLINRQNSAGSLYSATAEVLHPVSENSQKTSSETLRIPDVVLAEAVEGQAVKSSCRPAGRAEWVRRRLEVTRAESTPQRRIRAALTYCDASPTEAVRMVNRIAKSYARWQRSLAAQPFHEACEEAKAAASSAREDWRRAEAELAAVLKEHFEELPARTSQLAQFAREASEPAVSRDASHAAASQSDETTEQAEVNEELAQLNQRRTELLATRTAAHPAVKELDVQIDDLCKRLGSSHGPARESSSSPSAPALSSADSEMSNPEAQTAASHDILQMTKTDAAIADRYAKLSAAAESSRKRYEQLAEEQRGARDSAERVPACEIRFAEGADVATDPWRDNQALLIALFAAFAVACGTTMAVSGVMADVPLASAADAESALALPLLGTVPISGSAEPCAMAHGAQTGSTALVVCGVAVSVVSLGMLFLFLA